MAYPTTARTERENQDTETLGELGTVGLVAQLNEIQDDLTAVTEKLGYDDDPDDSTLDAQVKTFIIGSGVSKIFSSDDGEEPIGSADGDIWFDFS